ncbi:MAG: SdrD B-like domain-containing protein [Omnitrophica WOR_2 bacterium]
MVPIPRHSRILSILIGILVLALLLRQTTASAAPVAQFTPFPTPTPGPDGRVIYIAQKNDTAWRIAAIFGLKLDQLRVLNKWGENPIIQEGQQIILGFSGPAETSPTRGPSATPAPSEPTPTPLPGWGNLCVILYNDLNGDSLREETESAIPGGAISVTDRSGKVSKTEKTTGGLDPICFKELPEGNYNISVAVPEGYNPTTVMNQGLALNAGDTTNVAFGAQEDTLTLAAAPAPQGSGKSPVLGIAGAALLLLGAGLGLFAGRLVAIGSRPKKPDIDIK